MLSFKDLKPFNKDGTLKNKYHEMTRYPKIQDNEEDIMKKDFIFLMNESFKQIEKII